MFRGSAALTRRGATLTDARNDSGTVERRNEPPSLSKETPLPNGGRANLLDVETCGLSHNVFTLSDNPFFM